METGGSTALGPGLLTAVTMASNGKKGSKVILCTDGIANIGMGSIERKEDMTQSQAFYE